MKLRPDQEAQAVSLMRGLPLFAGLSDDILKALAGSLEAVNFAAGKVIIMEQEISRTLYLLNKGAVGIWRREAGEKRQLAKLAAPNFFGERSMFEERPASALVKAEEASELYVLPRAAFDVLSEIFPALKITIQKQMEAIDKERPDKQKPAPEDPAA